MTAQVQLWNRLVGMQSLAEIEAAAETLPPDDQSVVSLAKYHFHLDWSGLLAHLDENPDLNYPFRVVRLRALGEVGRLDDMMTFYKAIRWYLPSVASFAAALHVAAFGREAEAVKRILPKIKPAVTAGDAAYWLGVSQKRSTASDDTGRQILAELERTAPTERLKALAQQQLASTSVGSDRLSAASRSIFKSNHFIQTSRAPLTWARVYTSVLIPSLRGFLEASVLLIPMLVLLYLNTYTWRARSFGQKPAWEFIYVLFRNLDLETFWFYSGVLIWGAIAASLLGRTWQAFAAFGVSGFLANGAVLALVRLEYLSDRLWIGSNGAIAGVFGLSAGLYMRRKIQAYRSGADTRWLPATAYIPACVYVVSIDAIIQIKYGPYTPAFLIGLMLGMAIGYAWPTVHAPTSEGGTQ